MSCILQRSDSKYYGLLSKLTLYQIWINNLFIEACKTEQILPSSILEVCTCLHRKWIKGLYQLWCESRDVVVFKEKPRAHISPRVLQTYKETAWLFCMLHCCFMEEHSARHLRAPTCALAFQSLMFCAVDLWTTGGFKYSGWPECELLPRVQNDTPYGQINSEEKKNKELFYCVDLKNAWWDAY